MRRASLFLSVMLLLPGLVVAQPQEFKRERALKDLEGKPPPPLRVTGWMNTGGKALTLEGLRGKVVVLDFWGVW